MLLVCFWYVFGMFLVCACYVCGVFGMLLVCVWYVFGPRHGLLQGAGAR